MKIVKIPSEYYEEVVHLSEYAFQYKLTSEEMTKKKGELEEQHILGIFDGEKLASKLHILPFHIYQQGKKIPMGGVASVSSYPEYRRKGHIRGLMTRALEVMKEEGQLLAYLHPFSIDFYRKFGWEVFSDVRQMTIEKHDLSIPESEGKMMRMKQGTYHPDLQKAYEAYAQQYSGMLVREQTWWQDHLENWIPAIYYSATNQPEGYILYSIKDNEMRVAEFIAVTHEARKGLWGFIGQHDSMVDRVKMSTALSEPLPYMMKNPYVKMDVSPYFMARIVDVKNYLQQYTWTQPIEMPVRIKVKDVVSPWNNGVFLLSASGVEKLDQENNSDTAIELTINQLSALLLGYKTVKELSEINAIQGQTEQLEQLDKLIPSYHTYFPDFF